jgi:hypothetical protein
MMGRTERSAGNQRLSRLEQADDAVDFGGLQSLFQRQRRQNGGEPFREHGFAGAGRANEQNIVYFITKRVIFSP